MTDKNVLHSVSRTAKVPAHVRKLFAERRAIAESMIDDANYILSVPRWYTPQVLREARQQRRNGIKLLSMSAI